MKQVCWVSKCQIYQRLPANNVIWTSKPANQYTIQLLCNHQTMLHAFFQTIAIWTSKHTYEQGGCSRCTTSKTQDLKISATPHQNHPPWFWPKHVHHEHHLGVYLIFGHTHIFGQMVTIAHRFRTASLVSTYVYIYNIIYDTNMYIYNIIYDTNMYIYVYIYTYEL